MITLNTNLASLIVQSNLQKSSNALNTAIERMTSGYKINGAKDNAANYSITTSMSTKIGAYQVAEDNVAMGLDLLSTASENLDLISDKLTRLRALAEQSANGTYGEQSKQAINAEANALVDEIERLYNTTEYNGIKLYKTEEPDNSEKIKKYHSAVIPDDAQRVSKVTSLVSGRTYTLSSKEDLIALQNFTKQDMNSFKDLHFIMTSDIDMSGVNDFIGIGKGRYLTCSFDGNNYVIKNLKINKANDPEVGLFTSLMSGSEIINLGLENCDITGKQCVGGLLGVGDATVKGCYVTGKINGGSTVGGLVGSLQAGRIENCYFAGDVTGNNAVGSLVGDNYHTLQGCFSYTNVPTNIVGGYKGNIVASDQISNILDSNDMIARGFTEANGWYTKDGLLPKRTPFEDTTQKTQDNNINFALQVGIDSSENSSIGLITSFVLSGVSELRGIGKGDMDYLSLIDNMSDSVSSKQTQYGAVQNRLESSLEEISTQYENLVSSRSTLRDADIAEVSSEYIRQQILQQASATLLATANQSPSLALQLL